MERRRVVGGLGVDQPGLGAGAAGGEHEARRRIDCAIDPEMWR
jgi:hypothetical protein